MPAPLFRNRMNGLRSRLVDFKEVFTIRTLKFSINPDFTITQMIESLTPLLAVQFNINENDIEIVETGQYIPGCLSEAAPSLEPSNRKLCDIWGEDLRIVSFYVRRKSFMYPQIERNRREREARQNIVIESNSYLGDCPICLESTSITNRYSCSHGVCSTCYDLCQSASIASVRCCSLCRSV